MNLVDSKENSCSCVGKHIPIPHMLIELVLEDSSVVYVCPSTYHNIIAYKRLHNPPGSVRKHFSSYVQEIAERLDDRWYR